MIYTYPRVSQFWTYDPEEFLKQPVYSRDFPPCKHCSEATMTPIISADSHITEPPDTYVDHIDPAFRDRAPRMVRRRRRRGDLFVDRRA